MNCDLYEPTVILQYGVQAQYNMCYDIILSHIIMLPLSINGLKKQHYRDNEKLVHIFPLSFC